MNSNTMPEEMVMRLPADGLIVRCPFIVQIWFDRPISNVTIDTMFDDGTVRKDLIEVYEHTQPVYWKNHPDEGGYAMQQKKTYTILQFPYQLISRGFVQFKLQYDTTVSETNPDTGITGDTVVHRTYIFDMTTIETTIPEATSNLTDNVIDDHWHGWDIPSSRDY